MTFALHTIHLKLFPALSSQGLINLAVSDELGEFIDRNGPKIIVDVAAKATDTEVAEVAFRTMREHQSYFTFGQFLIVTQSAIHEKIALESLEIANDLMNRYLIDTQGKGYSATWWGSQPRLHSLFDTLTSSPFDKVKERAQQYSEKLIQQENKFPYEDDVVANPGNYSEAIVTSLLHYYKDVASDRIDIPKRTIVERTVQIMMHYRRDIVRQLGFDILLHIKDPSIIRALEEIWRNPDQFEQAKVDILCARLTELQAWPQLAHIGIRSSKKSIRDNVRVMLSGQQFTNDYDTLGLKKKDFDKLMKGK